MNLLLHWALAFFITEAVEIPIYMHAMRRRPRRSALAIAFGASVWTHPIVAFVIPALWAHAFGPLAYVPGRTVVTTAFVGRALGFLVLAEGFAMIGEALYLRWFGVERPVRWSVIANSSSVSVGAMLTLATGWP